MSGIEGREIQYKDLNDPLIDHLYRNGGEKYSLKPRECYEPLAEKFKLTEEERSQSNQKDDRNVWENMVQWARKDLVDLGVIDRSIHGRWSLTGFGIKKAESNINTKNNLQTISKNDIEPQINYDIREIINQTDIGVTEKSNLIQCRVGQGKYRSHLIDLWGSCSVTGFEQTAMLVASHIKPWSKSNNKERLDPYNGFLLLPNIDKVFDLGYITFDTDGKIVISNKFQNYEMLGLNENMSIQIKEKNKAYLDYHKAYVFK